MKKVDFVLKAIQQRPGENVTSREIGRAVNLTASQASYYLSLLADEGKIQRVEVNEHNLRYLWRSIDPNGILKPIVVEAVRAGFFDDVIREGLPTDPHDKAALLAYLQSEKYVRAVNTDPTGTNTEVTA